jgi:hypothetical protein
MSTQNIKNRHNGCLIKTQIMDTTHYAEYSARSAHNLPPQTSRLSTKMIPHLLRRSTCQCSIKYHVRRAPSEQRVHLIWLPKHFLITCINRSQEFLLTLQLQFSWASKYYHRNRKYTRKEWRLGIEPEDTTPKTTILQDIERVPSAFHWLHHYLLHSSPPRSP